MPAPEEPAELVLRLDRILGQRRESQWIEFKVNNANPAQIGEYISALSNGAALENQPRGYLVWGVEDETLRIVGTTFDPTITTAGGEELINYLTRQLRPEVFFAFYPFQYKGERVVLLEVEPAKGRPIRFGEDAYIRVGTYKKKLRDHPDFEKRLWTKLDGSAFEEAPATDRISPEQITSLLDYPAYYALRSEPLPENRSLIIENLESAGFAAHSVGTGWTITNLGALLLANNLDNFAHLARKAVRVIQYRGDSRIETQREQTGQRGYAAGFTGLLDYVMARLPENELITGALRESGSLYPVLALRELIANTVIHQDLSMHGSGPMIEMFDNRMEFTNPGIPLISPERFIDSPAQSRNERLAKTMRQFRICEERGSGWDKIVFQVEVHQLPSPLIEVTGAHTKVTLFAPRELRSMDQADRVRAVYQHACLMYVTDGHMTNPTVRKRFGIADGNAAQASRLINEALKAGQIVLYDPSVGSKARRYLPFWADPLRTSF